MSARSPAWRDARSKPRSLRRRKATLALVPAAKASDPEVLSVKAALDLALNPVDTSEIGKLAAAVEADPANHQARFDLAIALNAAGRREEALGGTPRHHAQGPAME